MGIPDLPSGSCHTSSVPYNPTDRQKAKSQPPTVNKKRARSSFRRFAGRMRSRWDGENLAGFGGNRDRMKHRHDEARHPVHRNEVVCFTDSGGRKQSGPLNCVLMPSVEKACDFPMAGSSMTGSRTLNSLPPVSILV